MDPFLFKSNFISDSDKFLPYVSFLSIIFLVSNQQIFFVGFISCLVTSSISIFGVCVKLVEITLGGEAVSLKKDILFEREILCNLQPVSPTDRVPSTGRLFSLRKIMYRGASFGSTSVHAVYILKIIWHSWKNKNVIVANYILWKKIVPYASKCYIFLIIMTKL